MAKGINVMLIGYWSLTDSLTIATIYPWLQLMQQDENVASVVFVTIEREENRGANTLQSLLKIIHCPLKPLPSRYALLTKTSDFIMFPRKISAIAKEHSVKLILAHGVLAGALAYKVWRRTGLPFYVSSFEPHAAYMADSGVWSFYNLKYRIQKYWEYKQQKFASGLITVTHAYRECLIQAGVQAAKVKTVCSPVQTTEFKFDNGSRDEVRKQLNWQTVTIGIYTGKYGGLYYNEEAFQIYQKCFELIPDFRLIILSPQPETEILQQLQKHDIDQKKVFIASVPHEGVPKYLSAADFGFATIKAFASAKYCSPVKVGEYWANGLPVLLTEGVGDESEIIKQEGGGALFNLKQPGSLERAIQQIQAIIQDPTHRRQIPALAVKYRSPERVREAYAYFFNQQLSGK